MRFFLKSLDRYRLELLLLILYLIIGLLIIVMI